MRKASTSSCSVVSNIKNDPIKFGHNTKNCEVECKEAKVLSKQPLESSSSSHFTNSNADSREGKKDKSMSQRKSISVHQKMVSSKLKINPNGQKRKSQILKNESYPDKEFNKIKEPQTVLEKPAKILKVDAPSIDSSILKSNSYVNPSISGKLIIASLG